ncbi:hypothetical protein PGT21_001916 [Puccinia graminis f. sp. tritici]|uniref:Uncharacterized protein n=1 Tax=Puccinia graminis f. sp. tritici TaxID=56615 RepID=A0A5B0PTK2_PUCGR|nr:hypothetical protein PGT21_001916 [Puccinia graminis f. sp. tritici]KAA1105105.1 hypothetical protein PGTUg99_011123 [Puccinia graminis f. sp. tritici]
MTQQEAEVAQRPGQHSQFHSSSVITLQYFVHRVLRLLITISADLQSPDLQSSTAQPHARAKFFTKLRPDHDRQAPFTSITHSADNFEFDRTRKTDSHKVRVANKGHLTIGESVISSRKYIVFDYPDLYAFIICKENSSRQAAIINPQAKIDMPASKSFQICSLKLEYFRLHKYIEELFR